MALLGTHAHQDIRNNGKKTSKLSPPTRGIKSGRHKRKYFVLDNYVFFLLILTRQSILKTNRKRALASAWTIEVTKDKKKHVKCHNQVSNPHVLVEQVECTSAMILQCSTIFCGGLNWVRFSGCWSQSIWWRRFSSFCPINEDIPSLKKRGCQSISQQNKGDPSEELCFLITI